MTSSPPNLTPAAWEQRYQEGMTRWDLGQPAPPLVTLLQEETAPKPGRLIVLGSGRGHDALWFAAQGFDVTGVDFAPSAIAAAQANARDRQLEVTFLQRDIFNLVPEFAQHFDYVVEHTCFCALEPSLRTDYVNLVHQLLKPTGQFIGLFFTHQRGNDGPPFGSTPEQIRALFAPKFRLDALEPVTNSVPSRKGEEHLGQFTPLSISNKWA